MSSLRYLAKELVSSLRYLAKELVSSLRYLSCGPPADVLLASHPQTFKRKVNETAKMEFLGHV